MNDELDVMAPQQYDKAALLEQFGGSWCDCIERCAGS